MTNITKAQHHMLARADEPEGLVGDDAKSKTAKVLIKKGLALSLPIDGGASRLVITEAGRTALAGSADGGTPSEPEPPNPPPSAPASRLPKGKLGDLVGLLSRPEGATVSQMMNTTGWQAHSIRGAMSGALKKKARLTIECEKVEGGERVYRIIQAKAETAETQGDAHAEASADA